MIALAEALGLPFEIKRLEYNGLRHLGPRLLGRSLISLTKPSRAKILGEPPPDLTISTGHRSVAAVRALRNRSSGRTRSIHIGFPRLSPGHFDLVIATPQYPISDHSKLLRVPYALTRDTTTEADPSDELLLSGLPRPRRLLIVGGPNIYWKNDESALLRTLGEMLGEARGDGGAVIVTTSPRTPSLLKERIARELAHSNVPTLLAEPGKPPRYASLLTAADSIRVTADSVAMVSDAIRTGKPVALVPVTKSALGRIAMGLMDAFRLPLYPQDLRAFWRMLGELGLSDRLAVPRREETMQAVLQRASAILDSLR